MMKNKKMGILAVLVMLVAVTLNAVGGTYAKYVSKIDMTDEARVAKWDVDLEGGNHSSSYDLSLFKNSYSYNGLEYVKAMDGESIVAPGTKATAEAKLVVTSEVRYKLNMAIEEANDFIVYFTVDSENKVAHMSLDKNDANFAGGTVYEYRPLTYDIEYYHNNTLTNTLSDVKANELANELAKYNANNANIATHTLSPGATHNFGFKITWKWDKNNSKTISNKTYNADGTLDTDSTVTLADDDQINRLDVFAGQNLSDADDKVNFKFSVVAEQVASDYAE